jgi:hypothetical protein
MTVFENIINNLRTFFGMPEATAAEIDQHLTDQVEQAEAPATDGPDDSAEQQEEQIDDNHAQQTPSESATENEPAPMAVQEILSRLSALENENTALRGQIEELEKQPAAPVASYEQTPVEEHSDPRDRYLCDTTLRALGRK